MSHPLLRIPVAQRRTLLQGFLLATLVLIVVFALTSGPLNTTAAPNGIVSFELAGSVQQARQIVESWDATARLLAAFGLGLDYLFMPCYATALALGCLWAGDRLRQQRWPLIRAASPLAWGSWLAALFDMVENLALVFVLVGPVSSPWPQLAQICASIKFALIFAGLVYVFLGAAVTLLARLLPEGTKA